MTPTQPAVSWALILTGFQNDYCAPDGALAHHRNGRAKEIVDALAKARRLLDSAREAGVRILHVPELVLAGNLSESAHWKRLRSVTGGPGMLVCEGTPGADFVDGLRPQPGEFVTPRFRSSCLSDTRVPVYLRSNGIRHLVIAGVETHRAVVASAVDAACLDYEVFVVQDAVGGSDRDLHEAALRLLPTWGQLVDVDDVVSNWRSHSTKESR